ncbi:MAG: hypothetical protein ACHQQ3_02445 [Gemmatimonadales bacterium]
MPKKPTKSRRPVKAAKSQPTTVKRRGESDRVTYRELRNTPGRVWERLAGNTALTLVADGEVKALMIPVTSGDGRSALDSYTRGRALLAMQNIQAEARRNGTSKMTLAEINKIIREVRHELRG